MEIISVLLFSTFSLIGNKNSLSEIKHKRDPNSFLTELPSLFGIQLENSTFFPSSLEGSSFCRVAQLRAGTSRKQLLPFQNRFLSPINKEWCEWDREVKCHSGRQLSINHYFYHLLKIPISSVRCICDRKMQCVVNNLLLQQRGKCMEMRDVDEFVASELL